MTGGTAGVVGAVLAGGAGRRMGGDKAMASLDGRPLIDRPLTALRACGFDEVVVVAKAATTLPPGVTRWDEPDQPRHPLTGIVHALRTAAGRAVFVCAVDMVRLDPEAVLRVCAAARPGDRAVVAEHDGRLQPLCALYLPAALETLEAAPPDAALKRTVATLEPRRVVFDDDAPFLNVNDPGDLRRAGGRA